jgi:hypothetical protein
MMLDPIALTAQLIDVCRERAIESFRLILVRAEGDGAKRAAWRSMSRLIRSRSPTMIRRLELARGLVHHE